MPIARPRLSPQRKAGKRNPPTHAINKSRHERPISGPKRSEGSGASEAALSGRWAGAAAARTTASADYTHGRGWGGACAKLNLAQSIAGATPNR